MQPLTHSGAASEKGYALKVAEERKMAAHNAECRGAGVSLILFPLLLSRWEVGAMKQPYRSPESADLLVRGLVLPPQKQFQICSSVCPSFCGEEMQPCELAAFCPTQLGLMGTFRYTFAVIVCICFCFLFFCLFVLCSFCFLFCLYIIVVM